MKLDGSNIRGFSKLDLVFIILACVVLLGGLIIPNLLVAREKARRVECLANLNGLHKGLASWGLDPRDPWRPPLPPTNMHSALKDMGIAPTLFICPSAARSINRSIGINPAASAARIASNNCNYNYWPSTTENDGDKALAADRNGLGNAGNAVGEWGGNHDGLGGNIVKVAGEGTWVGTNDILTYDMRAVDARVVTLGSKTDDN